MLLNTLAFSCKWKALILIGNSVFSWDTISLVAKLQCDSKHSCSGICLVDTSMTQWFNFMLNSIPLPDCPSLCSSLQRGTAWLLWSTFYPSNQILFSLSYCWTRALQMALLHKAAHTSKTNANIGFSWQ